MSKGNNKKRNKNPAGAPAPGQQVQLDAREIIRLANIIYFRSQVYQRTHWMGVKTAKCPMDMWMYQELMHYLNTDLVIETGTFAGGSALFFAQMMDLMGRGEVITIDIDDSIPNRPEHPRLEYITGSSIDPATIERLKPAVAAATSVMVILDADHRAPFKLQELELYAPLVTVGNYLIAEDSCFDEYPAWPEFGPGPAAAVTEFMKKKHNSDRFTIDRGPEHHMITYAPRAFLKRVK